MAFHPGDSGMVELATIAVVPMRPSKYAQRLRGYGRHAHMAAIPFNVSAGGRDNAARWFFTQCSPAAGAAAGRRDGPGHALGSGLMADRAVLVTGGSRGIGLAIVRAFATLGDRVAVHHRDSAGRAAEIVAGLPGAGHTAVQADLADPGAVRLAVDRAAAVLGGLDILVNNAGIYVEHQIAQVSYEQWQAAWRGIIRGNLTATAHVTRC